MFSWSPNGWTLLVNAFLLSEFDEWCEMTGKDRNTVLRVLNTAMKAGAHTVYFPNGRNAPTYEVDGFYWEVEA